jgi:hypothetical protein
MGRSNKTLGVVSKGVPYWSCFAGGIRTCQWIHGDKDSMVHGAAKPWLNNVKDVELNELLKDEPVDVILFYGCQPGANNPVWACPDIRHMVWFHSSSNHVVVPSGWTLKKTKSWTEAVAELAGVVAKNFSQSAYSGLQKSLQQEWQFVQRVKEGVGKEFTNIEELPALFGNKYYDDDPHWKLVCLLVKHVRLAISIPDPTTSAKSNYESSILICSHLLALLWGIKTF